MTYHRPKAIDDRLLALNQMLESDRKTSELETLCIHRQIKDLETGHERGLYWDEDEVQRNLSFMRLMKHWQGPSTGTNFEPMPWQEHLIIAPLFGWINEIPRSKGGRRRFRTGGIEVPRKNGKSFLASAIANQGLIADGESGASVYSAATKAEQARTHENAQVGEG